MGNQKPFKNKKENNQYNLDNFNFYKNYFSLICEEFLIPSIQLL